MIKTSRLHNMYAIKTIFLSYSYFLILFLIPVINLHGDANVIGKVIEASLTTPLEGVRVSLIDQTSEETIGETFTDVKGMYEFRNVLSGQYFVRAELQSYLSVSTNPLMINIEDINTRANFSLGIPGGIKGQVINEQTLLPIANAVIEVMRGNNILVATETNDDGMYQVENLAPRPYIVRVRMQDFQSNMQLAVPVPNTFLTLDFSMKFPPGDVGGRVFSQVTGEPIFNAMIDVFDPYFNIIDSVQSNSDGIYALTDIPPGSYIMRVRAHQYDGIFQPMTLLSNQRFSADFPMDPLGKVQGQVINKRTGQPIVGASVGMWKAGELIGSIHSDENGYFTLVGIKECQLVVQMRTFRDVEQSVNIPGGQTATANFALDRSEPTPPKRVVVVVSYKQQGQKLNRIHSIKWRESADPSVVSYRIYRDKKLIAEVSAQESFSYKDENRTGNEKKYEVTAVNELGLESAPTGDEGINDDGDQPKPKKPKKPKK